MMAIDIPFEFYDAVSDMYRLPDGRVVRGETVRRAKRERLERQQTVTDKAEAESGYDPYNTADDGNFMMRLVFGIRDPDIYEIAP